MDTLDILTVLLPTEINQITIFFGIIYFILIFYGTKQWKDYSEFDKVVFSVIFGGFVWYFFILPISIFVFTLNVFQKPEIIIPNDFSKYSYFIYFILAFYLIWWRLLKTNNRPLRDNNTFLKVTELLIVVTILLVALMDYALFVAFSFSTYQEHLGYIMASVISLVIFLLPLYCIFLKIFPINETFFSYSNKLPDLNFILKNKKLWALMILLISVVAALAGTYFLKTTTQLVDEKTNRLIIDDIFINRDHLNISGDYYVEQNYSIKFGLIPWTKMRPNITLRDSLDNPTNANYNFDGGYLLINNSRWFNTTNVILYGRKKDNVPPFYTLKIKDLNETNQRWDIIFYTNYTYDIDIYAVNIEKGNLRLINYTTDNLALNEVVNNPTDHYIVLKHVWFAKYWLPQYANHSITLFFEKNSTI